MLHFAKAKPIPFKPPVLSREEARVARSFSDAAKRLGNELNPTAVRDSMGDDAVLAAALQGPMDSFESGIWGLAEDFENAAISGGQQAASQIAGQKFLSQGSVDYSFNRLDPRTIAFAREQAGTLITEVTGKDRAILRQVLMDGVRQGKAPKALAADLRDTLTLTSRQAASTQAVYEGTRAALLEQGSSISAAEAGAERARDKAYERALRTRSETIARTEISRAQNAGSFLGWQQAIETGFASPDSRKRWMADGSSPCDLCAPVDDSIVQWDEPFDNGVMMPPAHPNCKCNANLLPPGPPKASADTDSVEPALINEQPLPEPSGIPNTIVGTSSGHVHSTGNPWWVEAAAQRGTQQGLVQFENLTIQNYPIDRAVSVLVDGREVLVDISDVVDPIDLITGQVNPWAAEIVEKQALRIGDMFVQTERVVGTANANAHKGTALIKGRNPADAYWEQKYKIANFRSAATGGDGSMTVWNNWDVHLTRETFFHEFGHNWERMLRGYTGAISATDEWLAAAASDSARWPSMTVSVGRSFKSTTKHHDPTWTANSGADYPNGITSYGQSSAAEDLAESMRLYIEGTEKGGYIGYTQHVTGGDKRFITFAEAFPERAKILERILADGK